MLALAIPQPALPAAAPWPQEPIFVPRPGGTAEDDGWVMTLVYDANEQRTRLAILDARNLSGGCCRAAGLGWAGADLFSACWLVCSCCAVTQGCEEGRWKDG